MRVTFYFQINGDSRTLLQFFVTTSLLLKIEGLPVTVDDGPFCNPKLLYRPYLRYYTGRHDATRGVAPFRIHGQGLHSDFLEEDLENTFICMNGIVWLYYAVIKRMSITYESPELHIFHHQCMLVNHKHYGPLILSSRPLKVLIGILLIGHPGDYRLPSGYVVYDDSKHRIASLFIVGDETECLIENELSGIYTKRSIRLRTTPVKRDPDLNNYKPNAGSFCKADYDNFEEQLATTAAVSKLAFKTERNKPVLFSSQCSIPQNYTDKSIALIDSALKFLNEELDISSSPSSRRAQKFELFSGDFDKYFDKPNRIPDIEQEKEYWPAKCPSEDECKQSDIDEKVNEMVQQIHEDNPTKSPPEKWNMTVEETLKTKLLNCMDFAFAVNEVLKSLKEDAIAPWNAAKEKIQPAYDAFFAAEEAFFQAQLKFHETAEPSDSDKDELKAAEEAYFTAQTEYLVEKDAIALAISAGNAYIDKIKYILEYQAETAYENLVRQYKIAKSGGNVYCPEGLGDEIRYLPTLTVIRRPGAEAAPPDPEFGEADKIPFELEPTEMPEDEMIQIEDITKDPTKYENDPTKTCGYIPNIESVCESAKPGVERACQIVQTFRYVDEESTNTGTWDVDDEWRQDVLDLIESIYITAVTPGIDVDLIKGVSRVVKAYFTNTIQETTLKGLPKDRESEGSSEESGRRLFQFDDYNRGKKERAGSVQKKKGNSKTSVTESSADMEQSLFTDIYLSGVNNYIKMKKDGEKSNGTKSNSTLSKNKNPAVNNSAPLLDDNKQSGNRNKSEKKSNKSLPALNNDTQFDSSNSQQFDGPPTNTQKTLLPRRRQFWDDIMAELKRCKERQFKIYLHRTYNKWNKEVYWVFRNYQNLHGYGYELYPIEENVEQADYEYEFNWAIDMNFFMFATVMGVCGPAYENRIPFVSSRFYTLYTEDFLEPLSLEWVNPRDNVAYKLLAGDFYHPLQRSMFPKMFMEGSFLSSYNSLYRPPRNLFVNDHTVLNFFVRGRFTGTSGKYYN